MDDGVNRLMINNIIISGVHDLTFADKYCNNYVTEQFSLPARNMSWMSEKLEKFT